MFNSCWQNEAMTTATLLSRIRGCVFGAALGDAVGAPFEFRSAEEVAMRTRDCWIDGLYPYKREARPHAVWQSEAPPGTGTDDTRYNWLFLELASELRRMPTAEEIAARYLEVYENPKAFFATSPDLASTQFKNWEGGVSRMSWPKFETPSGRTTRGAARSEHRPQLPDADRPHHPYVSRPTVPWQTGGSVQSSIPCRLHRCRLRS